MHIDAFVGNTCTRAHVCVFVYEVCLSRICSPGRVAAAAAATFISFRSRHSERPPSLSWKTLSCFCHVRYSVQVKLLLDLLGGSLKILKEGTRETGNVSQLKFYSWVEASPMSNVMQLVLKAFPIFTTLVRSFSSVHFLMSLKCEAISKESSTFPALRTPSPSINSLLSNKHGAVFNALLTLGTLIMHWPTVNSLVFNETRPLSKDSPACKALR